MQREVGTHLKSFGDGLRASLRQDPDIILVGEMRDAETISMAMLAAETGHLVFGTLHTTSATKSIDRIIDALPAEQQGQGKIFLKNFQIPNQIQTGSTVGMQLKDQALLTAVQNKEVDPDDAYLHANDKKQFQQYVSDPDLLPKAN